MISRGASAVYNLPIAEMPLPLPACSSRAAFLLFVVSFCWTSPGSATDWTSPAQELARKIAAAAGTGAVSLQVVNRSSLSKADVEDVERDLTAQMGKAGLRVSKADQAGTSIQVSLSENLQNYVWVAEVRREARDPVIVMTITPHLSRPRILGESAPMTIRKELLWSQEERILDVAVLEESPVAVRMAVLGPENVTFYRVINGRGEAEQVLPIVHAKVWPRDLRGRLLVRQGHSMEVFLPGVFCQGSTTPMSLGCRESDDPWPLSTQFALNGFFTPARNFFTGALVPGIGKQTSVGKFYSAAPIPRQASMVWAFAMIDGTLHLFDGNLEQVQKPDWGSDIAGVKTACGTGWQILATGSGDGPGDSIRAYEMPDREAVPVSPAVDFMGNVTALWSDEATSAIAVARNRQTGTYEAFRLAISCNR